MRHTCTEGEEKGLGEEQGSRQKQQQYIGKVGECEDWERIRTGAWKGVDMDRSHPSERQPLPHTGTDHKGDGKGAGGSDAVECPQGSGIVAPRSYSVDWEDVVGEGGFGTICRGRHVSSGMEVGVLTFKGSLEKREELLQEAKKGLALLLEQWPDAIQPLGTFDTSEKDLVTVMSVLQLRGVEDMRSFFASGATTADSTNKARTLEEKPATNVPGQQPCSIGCAAVETVCPRRIDEEEWKGQGEEDEPKEDEAETDYTAAAVAASDERTQALPLAPVPTLLPNLKGAVYLLGDYVVDLNAILGKGKFGTVYRGWHCKEGYEVAVKMLQGPVSKHAKLSIEQKELNRLQKLDHPNILRMFGVFRQELRSSSEIRLALVLELCRGGDLKEFLARHDPLSEQQAKHVMRQLVDFFCFLKSNRMMHRDLKPANILLTTNNIDEAVVKVADWGMAKQTPALGSGLCGKNIESMFESAVGTAAYMSPERLSRESYDYQAEVWALGVIMYELLFARHPYLHATSSVRTPEQLLKAITCAEEVDMLCKVFCSNKKRTDGDVFHQAPSEVAPLSRECYELMRHILDPNSKTRYTIEQVRAHPWIFQPEKMCATEEVQAVKTAVDTAATGAKAIITAKVLTAAEEEGAVPATAVITAKELSTAGMEASVPSMTAADLTRQALCREEQASMVHIQGIGFNLNAMQRQQFIYQAFRDYFYILRHNVLEAENDPGRGLVLLSYAWELFCAASVASLREEHPLTEGMVCSDASKSACANNRVPLRFALPDDIKLMENYIQETAQRLKRNLPFITTQKKLGSVPLGCSTDNAQGLETSVDSFVTPSVVPQKSTYPTAHTLLFQRTVSLIRMAATEELMLGDTNEQDSVMEEEETRTEGQRVRQQHMYEQAMAILRLILQQVVVCRQLHGTCPPGGIDMDEGNTVQVLTVPLFPVKDEADQRTVQALLHTVEKHYRRLVNIK
ncbi:putative tyrosine protein kinase [Trypanosoma rangeli]|uniref:Putative tyrosine protein kinase n=1 Tax=Trypanosoma rangeli TaxID=5698 RepID=A0A3R7LIE3_TRYRA|nr:putative tyrosine protein kinase [Trypanosoma rangeli]RNE97837.1 putative tyrosine protein kinase [Trypanosoma rangeli]|eukprot:RNE97837.1 putative tyrosine protein kinase [Trypanosoma rangeli]